MAEGVQGKTWASQNARDHCHGDPLTLYAHRSQEASFANVIDGMSSSYDLHNPRGRNAWPLPKLAQMPEEELDTATVYYPKEKNTS